jgi:hypothetical protein
MGTPVSRHGSRSRGGGDTVEDIAAGARIAGGIEAGLSI